MSGREPEFVRVSGLNAALILLGVAGLAFALFNCLVIGVATELPLILFALAAFGPAAAIGLHLWHTHDIERSVRAADYACFVAFLILVISLGRAASFRRVGHPVSATGAHACVGMRRGLLHVAVFFLVLLRSGSGLHRSRSRPLPRETCGPEPGCLSRDG